MKFCYLLQGQVWGWQTYQYNSLQLYVFIFWHTNNIW